MRVLVGCESSGKVREAFRRRGHEAWSCDLLPADDASSWHFQMDVRQVLHAMRGYFDLFIVHPTCTFVCNSSARHLYNKDGSPNLARWLAMQQGAEFFRDMINADIPMIAAENPIMLGVAKAIVGRGQDQLIQPWQFGHPEMKATCLWLKGLPKLKPTNNVYAHMMSLPKNQRERIHYATPGADRWKLRSETYQGIADAFAEQWGAL